MYRNYFTLNRAIIELNNSIFIGAKIVDIWSQDKDIIVFELKTSIGLTYLVISIKPANEYFYYCLSFNKSKKNIIKFFVNCVNSYIVSFQISNSDRIVKINTSTSSLYMLYRGQYSNLIHKSLNNCEQFKQKFDNIRVARRIERLIKQRKGRIIIKKIIEEGVIKII